MSPLLVYILASVLVSYVSGVVATYVVLCETLDCMRIPGGDPESGPEALQRGFLFGALVWPVFFVVFVWRVAGGR